MKSYIKDFFNILNCLVNNPRLFAKMVNTIPSACDGYNFFSRNLDFEENINIRQFGDFTPQQINPLWEYFQNLNEGNGIWKWEHYFDIYHRHFAKFIGKEVDVLEIGIYSGGSLGMWRSYFGEKCHIYGVDIEEACKIYANDYASVFIGDQADRSFWSDFKNKVQSVDIIIDDGGHSPEQQMVTLEEMLPNLQPGGVYLCEDVHDSFNNFSSFATSLVNDLNKLDRDQSSLISFQSNASPAQSMIHSIHFYPYVVVIEKNLVPVKTLNSLKHGTIWQPFFNKINS